MRLDSWSGVRERGPSAISLGLFGTFRGFSQQSGTPKDRVQNEGCSGGCSLGRQYCSPLSRCTTEQSRPDAADTAMSIGVRWKTGMLAPETTAVTLATAGSSGPQPANSSDRTKMSGIRPGRIGPVCPRKVNKALAGK